MFLKRKLMRKPDWARCVPVLSLLMTSIQIFIYSARPLPCHIFQFEIDSLFPFKTSKIGMQHFGHKRDGFYFLPKATKQKEQD